MRTTNTYWTVRRSGLQIHISPQTLECDGTYCYQVRMDAETKPIGKLGCNVFETKDQAVVAAYKQLSDYRRNLSQKYRTVTQNLLNLYQQQPLEVQEACIEEVRKK